MNYVNVYATVLSAVGQQQARPKPDFSQPVQGNIPSTSNMQMTISLYTFIAGKRSGRRKWHTQYRLKRETS